MVKMREEEEPNLCFMGKIEHVTVEEVFGLFRFEFWGRDELVVTFHNVTILRILRTWQASGDVPLRDNFKNLEAKTSF